jgi:PAS domain S-box-containing protein
LFLAVAALSTLVPAAVISERKKTTEELRESQEQYRVVAERVRALNAELEQRVAERTAALRASEEQYRTLAATAHDAIITADHAGRITYFNPGAERIFGYAAGDVVGAPLTLLMPERFHEPHRQGLARYLATGEARVVGRTVELVGRRKDGAEFPLELSLASRRQGSAPAFTGIIRDITERKEAEQVLRRYAADLETANKELEAFSYSVSHDLRAPLRSIHGFSQAVLEDHRDRLDAQGVQYLGRVCTAARHMGTLIDDLLELSRAIRAEMRREHVDLSRLAKRSAAELAATDPDRRVEFRIAEGLTCKGDQHLLALVLRNLLENGWKFTAKRDGAVVEVGVADEGAYFVRDNGAGFDMKYAHKLFQPFHRLHATRDFAGTGIGLALVQRIIRRHGGRVWAEAAADRGATFYFTVPDA